MLDIGYSNRLLESIEFSLSKYRIAFAKSPNDAIIILDIFTEDAELFEATYYAAMELIEADPIITGKRLCKSCDRLIELTPIESNDRYKWYRCEPIDVPL